MAVIRAEAGWAPPIKLPDFSGIARVLQHRRTVIATNTVHHDAAHPSRIILPVIGR